MASPRRIYRIYAQLAADAETIRDFLVAKGDAVPGTVERLIRKDRATLLARWAEEMDELCGVLDGTHQDSYLMEATQTFYWGTLFAVSGGTIWEDIRFEDLRRIAVTCGIATVDELRPAVARLTALGVAAKPEKLFLLWNVADRIYRLQTPADQQWSVEQMMEADLQEMKKRPYLEPILAACVE